MPNEAWQIGAVGAAVYLLVQSAAYNRRRQWGGWSWWMTVRPAGLFLGVLLSSVFVRDAGCPVLVSALITSMGVAASFEIPVRWFRSWALPLAGVLASASAVCLGIYVGRATAWVVVAAIGTCLSLVLLIVWPTVPVREPGGQRPDAEDTAEDTEDRGHREDTGRTPGSHPQSPIDSQVVVRCDGAIVEGRPP